MRNKFSRRLDAKVLGVHPRADVMEGRRLLYRQNLSAEGPLVTAGKRFKCPQLEGLPGSSGEKHGRASIAPLAFPYR